MASICAKDSDEILDASFRCKPTFLILEFLLTRLPNCSPFVGQHRLSANLEACTDRPVIRGTDLEAAVVELFDAAGASVENAIAPGGGAFLLT